jgi:hypothetical protein
MQAPALHVAVERVWKTAARYLVGRQTIGYTEAIEALSFR